MAPCRNKTLITLSGETLMYDIIPGFNMDSTKKKRGTLSIIRNTKSGGIFFNLGSWKYMLLPEITPVLVTGSNLSTVIIPQQDNEKMSTALILSPNVKSDELAHFLIILGEHSELKIWNESEEDEIIHRSIDSSLRNHGNGKSESSLTEPFISAKSNTCTSTNVPIEIHPESTVNTVQNPVNSCFSYCNANLKNVFSSCICTKRKLSDNKETDSTEQKETLHLSPTTDDIVEEDTRKCCSCSCLYSCRAKLKQKRANLCTCMNAKKQPKQVEESLYLSPTTDDIVEEDTRKCCSCSCLYFCRTKLKQKRANLCTCMNAKKQPKQALVEKGDTGEGIPNVEDEEPQVCCYCCRCKCAIACRDVTEKVALESIASSVKTIDKINQITSEVSNKMTSEAQKAANALRQGSSARYGISLTNTQSEYSILSTSSDHHKSYSTSFNLGISSSSSWVSTISSKLEMTSEKVIEHSRKANEVIEQYAEKIGYEAASNIPKRLIKKRNPENKSTGIKVAKAALRVTSASVSGVGRMYDGLINSAIILSHGAADRIGSDIGKKCGEHVGQVTGKVLNSIINVGEAAHHVGDLVQIDSIAMKTATAAVSAIIQKRTECNQTLNDSQIPDNTSIPERVIFSSESKIPKE